MIAVIPVNVVLLALVAYGLLTHRRWLWLSFGTIFVFLLVAFVMFGGLGSGEAGYILR